MMGQHARSESLFYYFRLDDPTPYEDHGNLRGRCVRHSVGQTHRDIRTNRALANNTCQLNSASTLTLLNFVFEELAFIPGSPEDDPPAGRCDRRTSGERNE
jgi:hypothetical protein